MQPLVCGVTVLPSRTVRCVTTGIIQAAILDSGGVPLILAALRTHVGVTDVAEPAFHTLCELNHAGKVGTALIEVDTGPSPC